MRAPYTQLYLHCVWATWDRLPLISPEIEAPIYAAILDKCQELKCHPIAIGGMPDHVHLLVRLHTTISVAELVQGVKGSSSHLITHQIRPEDFFKWQGAYGAFTACKESIDRILTYVQKQKAHHANNDLYIDWEMTMDTQK